MGVVALSELLVTEAALIAGPKSNASRALIDATTEKLDDVDLVAKFRENEGTRSSPARS
jgi:hypothetical protein